MDNFFLIIASGHNCARYAQASVDSVLAQTYKNYEAIFIDDGSEDDTYAILRAAAEKSDKVYPFRNREREGLVRARSYIKLQGHEIIVWLDLDGDKLLPFALEDLNERYNLKPDTWLTYGNFVTSTGERHFDTVTKPDSVLNSPREHDFFFTPLRSFRAKLYERLTNEDLFPKPEFKIYPDANALITLMELAGAEHISAIERPAYVYNVENPIAVHRRFTPEERAEEHARFKAISPRAQLLSL